MRLGHVIGRVTLSKQDPAYKGGRFLVVQPFGREQFKGAAMTPLAKGNSLVVYDNLGAGFTLWAGWQLSTAAGLLFGTTIPPEWELDFAVPLTFIALLTLLLRERAGQAAALVAALGALAFAALPYKLGLVAAIVYLVDVRPAVRSLSGGSGGSGGPYGGW